MVNLQVVVIGLIVLGIGTALAPFGGLGYVFVYSVLCAWLWKKGKPENLLGPKRSDPNWLKAVDVLLIGSIPVFFDVALLLHHAPDEQVGHHLEWVTLVAFGVYIGSEIFMRRILVALLTSRMQLIWAITFAAGISSLSSSIIVDEMLFGFGSSYLLYRYRSLYLSVAARLVTPAVMLLAGLLNLKSNDLWPMIPLGVFGILRLIAHVFSNASKETPMQPQETGEP